MNDFFYPLWCVAWFCAVFLTLFKLPYVYVYESFLLQVIVQELVHP